MYVKQMAQDITDAINAADIDRIKEIKGELRAMESVVSHLELCMGTIIGAIAEYQRKTQKIRIEIDEEEEAMSEDTEEMEIEKTPKKKNGNS